LDDERNEGDRTLKVTDITQDGIMHVCQADENSLSVERVLFPSIDKPMAVEEFKITNKGKEKVTVEMEHLRSEQTTDTLRSKGSPHVVILETINSGSCSLEPGQSTRFAVCYRATDNPSAAYTVDPEREESARRHRIEEILTPLQLETPDTVINKEFAFAKLRSAESIFKTKVGYLHGPGGLSYYAAIWANDQAEYVSPFFAFLGDRIANLSAMNCYRLFGRYMNPDYRPIPSSIVAEGDATWNGAGDRGDQAMIAYGASRYALTVGNADTAKALWPLIEWCLEYNRRHLNSQGVVESNSDELEGRFPSGKANLSTNGLYFDALNSAVMLARQLKLNESQAKDYEQRAAALKKNIEQYFGAKVQGYNTYRYYESNDVLRSWICIPLTMGIYDRSDGTIDALFSPTLWTADGLATAAGQTTFWDRSTLYALRGVLQAGATERAMPFLHYYAQRRLLGEHVPYPVEAYPEGNQRHLSAESGLFCRIFTEGMFGMRPTGFNSFNCTPRLPKKWKNMALNNIHAFNGNFSLLVSRIDANRLLISVKQGGSLKKYVITDGSTVNIKI
jgi:hypothetical protein